MLTQLDIRNIVLIDRLSLTCHKGLTALTGETGAGKSIILQALGLALGARAETRLIREGADKATVTASFDLPPSHTTTQAIRAILTQADYDDLWHDGEPLILRRSLGSDGRNKCAINDQPISQNLMQRIGEQLLEIHGQYDTHTLRKPEQQRDLLDRFGGLGALRDDVKAAWTSLQAAIHTWQATYDDQEQAARDEEYLRHAVSELKAAAVQEDEEAALIAERQTLMQVEKIRDMIATLETTLYGQSANNYTSTSQSSRGVVNDLNTALRQLERQNDHLITIFAPITETLARVMAEIEELENQTQQLRHDHNLDGNRQNDVEERLFFLRDLARKYRISVADLPAHFHTLQEKLTSLDQCADTLKQHGQAIQTAYQSYIAKAKDLSHRRRSSAQTLAKAIMAELPPLKLGNAELTITCTSAESPTEILRGDSLSDLPNGMGADGIDHIQFLVAMNAGLPMTPLHKTASGGELARLMLAIKVVTQTTDTTPVLIFDEIDTGMGGAVSEAVGQRLARLGHTETAQVFSITHAPQVAAWADYHWLIAKQDHDGMTTTSVTPLAPDARQKEIARMLAGSSITPEAMAAAQTLLDQSAAMPKTEAA